MSKPIKKILFISISVGAGHKRAAEALFLTCLQKYPQIEAKNIDLLDYSSWFFKKTTASLYDFLVKYLPKLYDLGYKATDYEYFAKLLNKLSKILQINNGKLQDFITNYSPDLIISTHFLTPALVKNETTEIPMDMVITDYGVHGLWLAPNVRNFYVATQEMAEELKKKKLNVFATGLPIHPNFFIEKNYDFLKAKFNLNTKWPTILLMSGGLGFKNQTELIKKIITNFPQTNLTVVSGKGNEILYKKYKQIEAPSNFNYQIIKFTTEIDELMRVADVIITKPGGITMTECAYLNKIPLLTESIPGQEEINEKYFTTKNLAIKLNEKNPIEQIKNLLTLSKNSPPKDKSAVNETILNNSLK